ncbi:MAG: anhydro-N-acetylmuramic acid kinase [Bacteroidales bacterium]
MSGTSLDGLDVVLASFTFINEAWRYSIYYGKTLSYPPELWRLLKSAHRLESLVLAELDFTFARWCGEQLRVICAEHHYSPEIVASHGHTVFHQPGKGMTLQIGNGAVMAAACGFPVVYDFRSGDVAMGGQGAPLVPVGDHLLFSDYRYCLNLGGIANVSTIRGNRRVAWDIVPVNMVLNLLSGRIGEPFDPDGSLAENGTVIPELLENLDRLPYYSAPAPKTLGREWVEQNILPQLRQNMDLSDLLRTYTEHVARQISKEVPGNSDDLVLVTGGGSHNRFLMERISSMTNTRVFIPEKQLVDFKEALVFGFLGLLRYLGQDNVLASVTGATKDHCAGSLAMP